MSASTRAAAWIAAATALAALLLWALHGRVLSYPFLGDDWYFLWETRHADLEALFGGLTRRANYWRPLGREIYFAAGQGTFGLEPAAFRWLNAGVLLATLAGLGAIAARLGGARAAVAAIALYALVPSLRVTLGWISCAQDLLAAALGVAAALCFLAGRSRLAALVYFLALFCKESVAPLPLALAAWALWEERSARTAARRASPLFAAFAAWAVTVLAARAALGAWNEWHGGAAVADVRLDPASLWAGVEGGARALLYAEVPWWSSASLRSAPGWAICAAAVLGLLAAVAPRADRAMQGSAAARFGALLLVAGFLPLALVGHVFSSYYVSFAAVGFALLAAAGIAALPRWTAIAVFPLLAFANGSIQEVDLYREKLDRAGISHFTARRLDRAAVYVSALDRAVAIHPPASGAGVYVTRVPTNVGFATAEDRALWVWRGDSTVALVHLGAGEVADPPPGSRFYRFDAEVGRFVILPDSLPHLVRESARRITQGDAAAARATLERAAALATGDSLRHERAALESALGDVSWQLGAAAEAEAAWVRALAADSSDRASLVGLARARAARGDAAGSDLAWQALVRAHPAFAESLSRRLSSEPPR